ncbi:MAG: hypothetical protein A3D24_02040 [Candidatus Blackburnbacteria bacterium RIFCSPHIGHO2_02_FULL_39_13]|uniref:Glycosyl transferase family 1 domain-containing protein n=1 Tax=Candidatus Blackburnbacteria bacterium RIFCSPLOWO2_01_FULL_40_20 TaxID=1797519 RepID=A0A1G1VDU1_9BACT|nr:MAG: Glycosyl transferase group 1 [Microgenomates group bacterium GW2011_GWA2_39_19]OGY06931.1 MAG: hypothetical protein A2694_04080 [Candidatus Blackburnbacteria bacterium RIFCSPHIGHO2_01_FULL_40_17]OGY09179.1 MAG: hypothetical protein A3D24_02040 [Candidatus Blackburnbacteria bacterium RIFCSPHIGHO2_02_FULL_39_13]OGY13584.1 MAG: hypothetical protein A3A77_04315 [Candidatus Blackburnbacteria bacterium RIFCSPLOWO2_01_FULL_40_20]HBL52236.1 glycosyltransferase family 4 protein [Candidatus Black
MKVALVYDRVNKWGGAERVLLALHELFPKAPLYTSVYNPKTAQWAEVFPKIIPSLLHYLPFARTRHDLYAPLMPLAFKSFDFSGFDLVISVTSEAAKSIKVGDRTKHICYCLTPTRYLWSGYDQYFNTKLRKIISWPLVKALRLWDKRAAQKPEVMIAISQAIADRIKKYYGREVEVIYPPVDVSQVSRVLPVPQSSRYYLVVSRLVPYKKVDIVIKAFNKLKLPLVIVGTGSEEISLRRKSRSKNTSFIGQVTDGELAGFYKNCKALIFPQDEDFGIVAVEAQMWGKPVLAYHAGGALETVVEGKTGIFFNKQTIESIVQGVKRMERRSFKSEDCINNAKKFTKEKFLRKFGKLTKSVANNYCRI